MSDVKRKPRIYIAGPFSGDQLFNIGIAIHNANNVMALGAVPFLPHTMTGFWHMVSPKPYEDWMELDLAWLATCDAMWVISEKSKGVQREMDECIKLDIPILRTYDDLLDFTSDWLVPPAELVP